MLPALRRRRAPLFCALAALPVLACGCGDVQIGTAKSVSTLAGAAGGGGFFDGSPSDPVRFDSPSGVAVIGTSRYVADRENHVIRKVDASGNVTTLAGRFGAPGSSNGTGTAARFRSPTGLAAAGTILYVTDTGNHTIRRIVTTSGEVTNVAGLAGTAGTADGTGILARFSSPTGIATDGGSILYVADTGNHTLRKVTASGTVGTIAGDAGISGSDDGTGADARFSSPEGVTLLGTSLLYVSDTGNHTLRKVVLTASFGTVTTLAGSAGTPGAVDASGSLARFSSPAGIVTDGALLIVCDAGNHTLRRVTQAGDVATLAGTAGSSGSADGTGADARFFDPAGIATGGGGIFALADRGNHLLRQVTLAGDVSTLAGAAPRTGTTDGVGSAARFSGPGGIALLGDDRYVTDSANHTVRKIASGGTVSTLAGSPGTAGSADGFGSAARFRSPGGIATLGGNLYVSDTENHTIRKITPDGNVSTVAGSPGATGSADGTGTSARFSGPRGIVSLGGDLYVADTGNHAVRKVTLSGVVTTLAGLPGTPGSKDGTSTVARFDSPQGIASAGTSLYVADTGNHTVRKVATPSGAVSTFAGSAGSAGYADDQGTAARFDTPRGITAVDSVLYVADTGNHAVRRISSARNVTTFAGDPAAATTRDGDASRALLNAPVGIAGTTDTLYVTDERENVVREIFY